MDMAGLGSQILKGAGSAFEAATGKEKKEQDKPDEKEKKSGFLDDIIKGAVSGVQGNSGGAASMGSSAGASAAMAAMSDENKKENIVSSYDSMRGLVSKMRGK